MRYKYVCSECGRRFATAFAFDFHRIIEIGDNPLGPYCRRRCMTNEELILETRYARLRTGAWACPPARYLLPWLVNRRKDDQEEE